MKLALCLAAAAATLLTGSASHAATIGNATNADFVVHYNSGTPEVPGNIAYVSMDSVFNFVPALSTNGMYGNQHLFQSVQDQFRVQMVFALPTNTTGAPAAVQAKDGNTIGGQSTTSADWAITDPSFSSGFGNSVFKGGTGSGSSISFQQTVTPIAGGFHMELTGSLQTDNLIHWASAAGSNGNGTSSLSNPITQSYFPSDGKLYFTASLDYLRSADETPGEDHYVGSVAVSTAVPLPASASMSVVGLAGCLLRRKR